MQKFCIIFYRGTLRSCRKCTREKYILITKMKMKMKKQEYNLGRFDPDLKLLHRWSRSQQHPLKSTLLIGSILVYQLDSQLALVQTTFFIFACVHFQFFSSKRVIKHAFRINCNFRTLQRKLFLMEKFVFKTKKPKKHQ